MAKHPDPADIRARVRSISADAKAVNLYCAELDQQSTTNRVNDMRKSADELLVVVSNLRKQARELRAAIYAIE